MEIEFRGKATGSIEELEELGINHTNGWVHGSYIDGFIINTVIEASDEYISIGQWCQVDSRTVGQYTGLKGYMSESYEDLEEKGVYRGDIIDIFWEDYPAGFYRENHVFGVVDFDVTGTTWVIKNARYETHGQEVPDEIGGVSIKIDLPKEEDLAEVFLHEFNLTSSDITILGNIHDNPELLEVSE